VTAAADPFAPGTTLPALVAVGRWTPDPPLPAPEALDEDWHEGTMVRVAEDPQRARPIAVQRMRFSQFLAAKAEVRAAGRPPGPARSRHLGISLAMRAGSEAGPWLLQRRGAGVQLPGAVDGTATGLVPWPDEDPLPDLRATLTAELEEETGWPSAWWVGTARCHGVRRLEGAAGFLCVCTGVLRAGPDEALAAFRPSEEVPGMLAVPDGEAVAGELTPFVRWLLAGGLAG
jgi:hypothetical protein